MREIEARLAALELLAIERLAELPSPQLARLRDAMAADLARSAESDERMVRAQALELVEDAMRKAMPFSRGYLGENANALDPASMWADRAPGHLPAGTHATPCPAPGHEVHDAAAMQA
jgi:hypothetical protein